VCCFVLLCSQTCQPRISRGWSSTGFAFGFSHKLPGITTRFAWGYLMNLVPRNSRLGWFVTPLPRIEGGINVHRGFRFLHGLSVSLDPSKAPLAQIHHCVIPFATPLTRAVFPRFLITTLPIGGCSTFIVLDSDSESYNKWRETVH